MRRTRDEELALAALRGELPEPSAAEIAEARAADGRRIRRRRAFWFGIYGLSVAAFFYVVLWRLWSD